MYLWVVIGDALCEAVRAAKATLGTDQEGRPNVL